MNVSVLLSKATYIVHRPLHTGRQAASVTGRMMPRSLLSAAMHTTYVPHTAYGTDTYSSHEYRHIYILTTHLQSVTTHPHITYLRTYVHPHDST